MDGVAFVPITEEGVEKRRKRRIKDDSKIVKSSSPKVVRTQNDRNPKVFCSLKPESSPKSDTGVKPATCFKADPSHKPDTSSKSDTSPKADTSSNTDNGSKVGQISPNIRNREKARLS